MGSIPFKFRLIEGLRWWKGPTEVNRLVALILTLICAATAMAEPAQVIIIRHAEKPKDPGALHLSSAGRKRAKELARFFKEDDVLMRHGEPSALFATKETKNGGGQRTKETLEPLAKDLGIMIKTPYKSDDYLKLASHILGGKDYEGKTVIICWTHEFIPQLIGAFGIHPTPEKLDGSVYDRVYNIEFRDGKPELKITTQELKNSNAHHRKKRLK